MKNLITALTIMLLCANTFAQQRILKNPDESRFSAPVSLQILTGSQGIGADIKYGFTPKLAGRLGFGIIPVDASRAFKFSAFPVLGELSTRFSNMHLLADYSPLKNKNFRIVGGASYLIKGDASVIITPSGGYTIGSRSITQDQFGAIYADVKWKGVAPYLGLALLRSFPHTRFNVNFDVGTYYISSPGTSFTGTRLLSDNDPNAKQFNQNMEGYRWLPVVQVNFNFRIK